jgi:hypothetical protein
VAIEEWRAGTVDRGVAGRDGQGELGVLIDRALGSVLAGLPVTQSNDGELAVVPDPLERCVLPLGRDTMNPPDGGGSLDRPVVR